MHTARTIRDIKVIRPITHGSKQILFLALTTACLRKKVNGLCHSAHHIHFLGKTDISEE
jgi:hypothetical protein